MNNQSFSLSVAALALLATSHAAATTLEINNKKITNLDEISVSYTGVEAEDQGVEWVAVFKDGSEPDENYGSWSYLSEESGNITLPPQLPGDYYLTCLEGSDYTTEKCQRVAFNVEQRPVLTVTVEGLPKYIDGISNNFDPDLLPTTTNSVMQNVTISYDGLIGDDTLEEVTEGAIELGISQDGYRFTGLTSEKYEIVYDLNTQLYVNRLPQKSRDEIRVVSANVWRTDLYGWDDNNWNGLHMGRGGQVIRTILELDADVVGMQEYMHPETEGLDPEFIESQLESESGEEWHSCHNYRIVTKLEVVAEHKQGCEVLLPNGKPFYFGEVHLGLDPDWANHYVPYTAHQGWSEEEIVTAAADNWGEGNDNIISESAMIGDSIPAFFVGDYNEPSHNDYTQAAADYEAHKPLRGKRIPLAIPSMPMSNIMLNDLGYVDTYDVARQNRNKELNNDLPAEINFPGVTWGNYGVADAHRIDFIYYRDAVSNPMKVKDSFVIGGRPDPNADYPFANDHVEIPYTPEVWPSDHRWVLTSMTYETEQAESGGSTGPLTLCLITFFALFGRREYKSAF
ncbi:hypothetical protein L1D15_00200 [Vibrio sp. Isolate25]|uniref:hypothetical protein n=1 Tax=Vibrio sp. Isolate25 TaxID=2908535 RepID=UPI001EFED993|nr:hypothetical protein [Vibrio sp. Isolate25]MCG9595131.1 hypothetical protein [Vibrio sp. Isolate25]